MKGVIRDRAFQAYGAFLLRSTFEKYNLKNNNNNNQPTHPIT